MATSTWLIKTLYTNFEPHETIGFFTPIIGVFNRGYNVIEVRDIWLDFPTGTATPTQPEPSIFEIQRITDVTGGRTLAVTKFDEDSASLPSQVVVRLNGRATTSSTIREIYHTPGVSVGSNTAPISTAGAAIVGVGAIPLGSVFRNKSTSIQNIVLREGQGITITATAPTSPHRLSACLIFRNANTLATYCAYTTACPPTMVNDNIISLMNGSGSGVTLELVSMELISLGDGSNTTFYPSMRFTFLHNMSDGPRTEDITPIAMDTNAVFPSDIDVKLSPRFEAFTEQRKVLTNLRLYNLKELNNALFDGTTEPFVNLNATRIKLVSQHSGNLPFGSGLKLGQTLYKSFGCIFRNGEGFSLNAGCWEDGTAAQINLNPNTYQQFQINILMNVTDGAAPAAGNNVFLFNRRVVR